MVVPKPLRDELRLEPGQQLEIIARDGHLEIDVALAPVELAKHRGVVAAIPDSELPPLTAAQVRTTLEQTRR